MLPPEQSIVVSGQGVEPPQVPGSGNVVLRIAGLIERQVRREAAPWPINLCAPNPITNMVSITSMPFATTWVTWYGNTHIRYEPTGEEICPTSPCSLQPRMSSLDCGQHTQDDDGASGSIATLRRAASRRAIASRTDPPIGGRRLSPGGPRSWKKSNGRVLTDDGVGLLGRVRRLVRQHDQADRRSRVSISRANKQTQMADRAK